MNRRHNPGIDATRRGSIFALFVVVAVAATVAMCSGRAQAKLPDYPTVHLTDTSTVPSAPVAAFLLRCAPGLNVTGASSLFADVIQFTPRDFDVPVGTMSDGDWTCYVDILTSETPVRWGPTTNRVSFTVKKPLPPLPLFRILVD